MQRQVHHCIMRSQRKWGSHHRTLKNRRLWISIDSASMTHYLLECRNYREQTKKLREVGKGKMRVERLLGDSKTVKYTMEYIRYRQIRFMR
jgi:hypothetical protein